MYTYIYVLIDPFTNLVRYVGKTDHPEYRLKRHCQIDLEKNTGTKKEIWIRSLLKLDSKPILEIIDEVDINDWQFWEIFWISQFKTWGFNLTNGDDGGYGGSAGREIKDSTRAKLSESGKKGVGWKHTKENIEIIRNTSKGRPKSEETLKKLSESNKGKNLGKKHTEETRKKISKSNTGRIKSEETLKKLSNANKGKKHTEETRKKMSESRKGITCKIKNPRSDEYREKQRKPKGPLSEEAKMKISKSNTGKIKTEETRKKLSDANKGKKHTEETKKKIGESVRNRKYESD